VKLGARNQVMLEIPYYVEQSPGGGEAEAR
jgi:hypothetical protein